MSPDFAAAAGLKPAAAGGAPDFAGAAGLTTSPGIAASVVPHAYQQSVYQSAQRKLKTGESLTPDEAGALADMQSVTKGLNAVGAALQPFMALSDVVKGIGLDVQSDVRAGKPNTTQAGGNRGIAAALGHLTYGLSERLPGLAGSRANGVSGAELLKGTQWEGNPKAALAVELLSDPSLVFTGAGIGVKGAALLPKLAQLEKLAKTAEGQAMIRGALQAADKTGSSLLRLGDEATGLPAVTRVVAATPAAKATKAALSKLADTTLPKPLQSALGVRTYGDAFFTPDMKTAVYTPLQLGRDEFRDSTRLATNEIGRDLTTKITQEGQVIQNLTKGLKAADATEVNRLLGVFTTATKPEIAAEALRKLTVLSQRVGKDLEPAFVKAVQAVDRTGQVHLGPALQAQGLPEILDPAVTKAIQDAQTGADLLPHVGGYKDEFGRPRAISMTQYVGRSAPDAVIPKIAAEDPSPASVTLDPPKLAATVDTAAPTVPVPPRPLEPVGIAPRGAPPLNPAGRAEVITSTPVSVTTDAARAATAAPPVQVRSPSEVMDELFGSGAARATPDVAAPPRAAAPDAPAPPVNTIRSPAEVMDQVVQGGPPASGVNSPADLGQLGNVGAGMADSMHDMLYGKYTAGDTTELGKPSNILIGAQQLKTLGTDLTREQWPDFANRFYQELTATSGAPDRADRLRQFLTDYEPPAPRAASVNPAEREDGITSLTGDEGMTLYHGSGNPALTADDIQIVRTSGQLQGKRGRVYGGFYTTSAADAHQAESYAALRGGTPTVYQVQVPAGVKVLTKTDDVTRLGEKYITELRDQGYGMVIGEDARGRTEYVVIDKNAIGSLTARGAQATSGAAPAARLATDFPGSGKTPAEVMADLIAPKPNTLMEQAITPDGGFTPTSTAAQRAAALPPTAAPERLVTKAVPTTYRTAEVDSSALDWGTLPDANARREVANVLGDGAGFERTATGWTINKPYLTVPLDHPVIGRYFDNASIEQARTAGSAYGELSVVRREQVPDWYDPKSPLPMDAQRSQRAAEQAANVDAAVPNSYRQLMANLEVTDEAALNRWITGDAYASWERMALPQTSMDRLRVANDFSQRVTALLGRPATPGELFAYRMRLARVQQAERLRNLSGADVADHLKTFYSQNPEATLYEGVLSAAKTFGTGYAGAKHLQALLRQAESGFERQMSKLERLEFAQYIKRLDGKQAAGGGGSLISRLIRNPQEVSREFLQVFPLETNALKTLSEQARTRTAAVLESETLRQYHGYLKRTGQHLTERDLISLRRRPKDQLTPQELELRESIARASEQGGIPAGWKVMDRNYGPFAKGDAVPWWAYHDLFGASSIEDAAVKSRILQRGQGGFWENYDRFNATINANLLSSLSSIVNDQIGQLHQMIVWGVTPDQIINGIIQRAAASASTEGRAALKAMRDSGIASAKLESNLGRDVNQLRQLAIRLDTDTDMTRMQRVIDGVLRFREYGTGVNRGALSHPAAKVAADVTHLGSAYLFQIRSAMSDLQRESLYFHYLSEGQKPAEAARSANTVLMDMRLAPAYAKVTSRFWAFFRWTAMSGPRSIVAVMRHPGMTYALEQTPRLSDIPNEDGKNDVRRILARDPGYVNLGLTERSGARVYLDPRAWDSENTIPQLLDWSGTKLGAVSPPWFVNWITSVGWGIDRTGQPVYKDALDGAAGTFADAMAVDPKSALVTAAKTTFNVFRPSFAPGSARAQALAASIIETAQLPDDGSRDITIAKTLMGTEWGRATIRYMQQGEPGIIAGLPMTGNRQSPYSLPPASMARSALNFVVPIRAVNADQNVQGDAQAKVMTTKLQFTNWLSGERKRLAQMEAAGATQDQLDEETTRIEEEAMRRGARLEWLDEITR